MTNVYIDWNVLNRIEKKSESIFEEIEKLILDGRIIIPYSNAHINDLVRGYEKNPDYIQGHLSTIQRLTNNLCIVQYWGEKSTRWHYRDINEFFKSALDDIETSAKSFKDLFSSVSDDSPEISVLWEAQLDLWRNIKLPDNFKKAFKESPIFAKMFPKSKSEMNMLALQEDIFDFSFNAKKDYSLYKTIRGLVNHGRVSLKNQPQIFKGIDKSMSGIPTHLSSDDIWDKYSGKTKITDNPAYQKITGTYQKIDFRGVKSDERFANMIDDSLHVFYAAHCDCFITLDDKCAYKAIETYKELKIDTKVFKPEEFVIAFGT